MKEISKKYGEKEKETKRKWRKKGRGSLRISGWTWCCFLLFFDLFMLCVKGRRRDGE